MTNRYDNIIGVQVGRAQSDAGYSGSDALQEINRRCPGYGNCQMKAYDTSIQLDHAGPTDNFIGKFFQPNHAVNIVNITAQKAIYLDTWRGVWSTVDRANLAEEAFKLHDYLNGDLSFDRRADWLNMSF